jgi:hypothetical protein
MSAYPYIFGARGGAVSALAVTLSEASPEVGTTIAITATPAGFTPTSYQFLLFNGSVTLLAQQAGNTLNWTVNVPAGTYDIYVLATNGNSNTFGSASINVQSTYWTSEYGSGLSMVSLFKLSPSVTSCLRVRRSSDSAEQDFGFVSSTPYAAMDVAGIQTFIGAGDGFVTTWYDQSGNNNHILNTTALQQPLIAQAGAVFNIGGIPEILFNSSRRLQTAASFNLIQPISSIVALRPIGASNYQGLVGFGDNAAITGVITQRSSPNRISICSAGASGFNFESNQILDTNITLGDKVKMAAKFNTPDFSVNFNGALTSTTNGSNTLNGIGSFSVGLGWSAYGSPNFRCNTVMMYNSDKEADFASMITDLNTYY